MSDGRTRPGTHTSCPQGMGPPQPRPPLGTTRVFHWVLPLPRNLVSSALFSKTPKAPVGPRPGNLQLAPPSTRVCMCVRACVCVCVCVCRERRAGARLHSKFFPDSPTLPSTTFSLSLNRDFLGVSSQLLHRSNGTGPRGVDHMSVGKLLNPRALISSMKWKGTIGHL